MHHFVGATTFLVESGAEMRGRQQRAPVSAIPYASSLSILEMDRLQSATLCSTHQRIQLLAWP